MEVFDRNGYSRRVGRIGSSGNVFDSFGYDTGITIHINGKTPDGKKIPGTYVDEKGNLRDRMHGGPVSGYTNIRELL